MAPKSVPSRALLAENELVGDDWLEDDMEMSRPQKKIRMGEAFQLIGRRERVSFKESGTDSLRPVSPPSPQPSLEVNM